MNAHGEGYVKGFLDAGSIPAGSTNAKSVRKGTFCVGGIGLTSEPVAHTHIEHTKQRIWVLFAQSVRAMRGHIPHSGILRKREQLLAIKR